MKKIKLWVDDLRPAPTGYFPIYSVDEAKVQIEFLEEHNYEILEIALDHDAGEYAKYGGDYINILNWFEETGRDYPISIHTGNAVGAENMRRIIERNGWKEIR